MKIGSIKPEVIALREFFREESPLLRIPSIQRQFVWDAEDVKELIDSIINDYPIGAVIIWEPASKFPSAPLVGTGGKFSTARYVLDGQQRLTALMLIQNGWELVRGSKTITTTPISFVPENGRLYLSAKKGIDVSLIVNATMGDADCLTKLQKEYPASYRKAMGAVGEKIVNYKLPFYVLKSASSSEDEYEKIAEIFTRVNSAGVKIGNLEMFLSFFAAAFPKREKDRIISIHEELSEDVALDLEPLVRFVFSRMGMTQNQVTKVTSFKKSIQELKDRYSKDRQAIGKTLDCSYRAIKVIIALLDADLGLSTTQNIPSQNVLLPLFDAAYEKGYERADDIPLKERHRLLKWFIIASFNGIYSSSPNYKIEEDLKIVRANPKGFPLDELLSAMQNRAPHRNRVEKSDILDTYANVLRGRTGKEYLMLLDILLYRDRATDWAGKMVESESAAIHHIFPREFLKENSDARDDTINCLANLTFISPSVNSEIGDTSPEDYLPQYTEEILRQHYIPPDRRLWKIENFQQFLEARLKLIWKETSALIESLS
jgi:hypothetical protein